MAELRAGFDHLPLGDVIRHMTGEDLPLYHDQLAHGGRDDPFWAAVNFRGMLADWAVPILLVDGWHDYPLPGVLDDYAILRDAPRAGAPAHRRRRPPRRRRRGRHDRRAARLVRHLPPRPAGPARRTDRSRCTCRARADVARVRRLAAAGDTRRRGTSTPTVGWPPMRRRQPSAPDRYRYDPADPTPSIGGIGMLTGGALDNRGARGPARRARVHGDALAEPLELIGPVSADGAPGVERSTTSTCSSACCDVHPDGASLNVCDGLQRFTPRRSHATPTACSSHVSTLWPIGHRFAAGHRAPRAGLERIAPGLRAQPRHRRAGRDRGRHARHRRRPCCHDAAAPVGA